jgi:L-ascorbate metabolism protein UlaG (beta-lactamase superfamily)
MNALAREIRNAIIAPGSLRIWWIGQEGFVLKSPRLTIYIDPYLSDYAERITRGQPNEHVLITPPPLKPEDVDHADLVFCTHDHADHIDPDGIPVIARRSPNAQFIVPRCAVETMQRLGVALDRVHTFKGDDELMIDGVAVHAVPAMHERFDRHPEHGYPYLSYVLRIGGINLFHAGDTIPYDGQVERVAAHRIDLACVPINGRDDFRHALQFEGNFTCEEAVKFAAAVRAGLTIPMHYDKFTLNTGDVNEFCRIAQECGVPHRVMRAGESFLFRERGT